MKTKFSTCILVTTLFALASSAVLADTSAPPTTGTPPLSSITGGPFDRIDLSNLDVHFSIPVFSRAGVSMPFSYNLSYDSLVWVPVTLTKGGTVWLPMANWGWRTQTDAATGYVTNDYTDTTCPLNKQMEIEKWTNFVYHGPSGTSHPFLGAYIEIIDDPGTGCSSHGFTSATASDGSGYILKPGQAWTGDSSITTTIISSSGLTIIPPTSNATSGNGTITDPNNNKITVGVNGSTTTLTDTLNTTALTISGTPPSTVSYTYNAPSGQAAVKVSYVQYWVQTCFQVSGISEYPAKAANLVDTITLPDGTHYHFTYETTVGCGASGKTTGRIASVTLPTGGVINYSYAGSGCGNNSNCMMADGSPTYMTRNLGGGAWTYVRGYQNGIAYPSQTTMMVVDPANDETDLKFSGVYEAARYAYQGRKSALLKHTTTTYNGCRGAACETGTVTSPISEKTVFDHFSDPSYNYWVAYDYFYDQNLSQHYGLLTTENDFDYREMSGDGVIRSTVIAYDAPLCSSKNICNHRDSAKITDGNWVQEALTNYHYDANGNTTEVSKWVSGGNYLNQYYSYNQNGTVRTVEDPNTWSTIYYTYGYSCNGAFPNSVGVFSQYANQYLYTKYTYNCNGSVITSVTDPNGHVSYTNFNNDKYFWRPDLSSDLAGNVTYYNYYSVNNSGGSVVTHPGQVESVMNWNGGASTTDNLATVDGYGRTYLKQTRQAPGSGNWDTTNYFYDTSGRLQWLSRPIVAGAGVHSGGGIASTGYTYDALGRYADITDWTGIHTDYYYNFNDVKITVSPAPTGENTKSRQSEYDALGRLTSVCEITSATGSGACAQYSGQTGFFTSYNYDPLGNMTNTHQSGQARSFVYDGLSRMTQETNPENGTTRYVYDSINDGHCNVSSPSDKVERIDAASNYTCYAYDSLHRIGQVSYPSGPNTANMPYKYFYYDLPPWGLAVTNALGRMTAAYTLLNGQNQVLLGFSYDARGSMTREWNLNYLNVGNPRWYTTQTSYAANGALATTQGFYDWTLTTPFTDNFAYTYDGEGRPWGLWDGTTSAAHWCCTSYNPAGQPSAVQSGGNRETFQYDPNSGRMTQWQDTTGTLQTGNLTWNANGTLAKLAISDNANPANNQTCTNSYDDLARVSQNFCTGSPGWSQSFTYDAFGNIEKTGSFTFNPTYDLSTNHIKTFHGYTFQYDGMGNVTSDGTTYSYDAEGRPVIVNGNQISYDALGREAGISTNAPILYSPTGAKFAVFKNGVLQTYLMPMVAGTKLEYTGSGLPNMLEADWQGSSRVGKGWYNTVEYDRAYAPFGEFYAEQGSVDRTFTGPTSDVVPGIYDFQFRQLNANQGRWVVPDPAGLTAVDITNPQTWNRYAYVGNNPLSNVDPQGLCGEDNSGPDLGEIAKGAAEIGLGVAIACSPAAATPLGFLGAVSLISSGIFTIEGAYGVQGANEMAETMGRAGNPPAAIASTLTDNQQIIDDATLAGDIITAGMSGDGPNILDDLNFGLDSLNTIQNMQNANNSTQLPDDPYLSSCYASNTCENSPGTLNFDFIYDGNGVSVQPSSGQTGLDFIGGGGGGGGGGDDCDDICHLILDIP